LHLYTSFWDESLPQYKALWWIVHDDPAQMMTMIRMKMLDENLSLSNMIVERYIMAALYFATDRPNWILQINLLGNCSICNWNNLDDGVGCNGKGSVVTLAMCSSL
jgi:hypothetical protein